MTANPAKPTLPKRRVVFLVYPNIVLLDLVGPLQVFSHAYPPHSAEPGYECVVVSLPGGLVETNTVVAIPTQPAASITAEEIHTLVIVGGDGAIPAMEDPALTEMVRRLSKRAKRVCSVCSGALVLAAAGLLDGRRATTHWEDCDLLQRRFPQVRVELDPIFIQDGSVWTSAGITAGIDMALAIVAEDLGRAASFKVARSMVAQMVRSGGQSQFSPVLGRQQRDGTGQFEALHSWIAENLQRPLPVETLAAQAHMSPRNFARVYSKVMGITPAKAVEAIRVERAQDLLARSSSSNKQIAAQCGFKGEDRMRRAFLRLTKVSPSEYRQNFKEPERTG
ncbi:GlxA family transcriptional regulator [Dinoroseobacter sp. S76]|uniref:GlxA family transcriptional regulator n=1 Tax=Dinoroseobacter sp. S76 TaxID=3415124 RepID=UPI003C7C1980